MKREAFPRLPLLPLLGLTVAAILGVLARKAQADEDRCRTARTLQSEGRVVEARAQLCATEPCDHDLPTECAELRAALDEQIATVTFDLTDASGHLLPDATVFVDGHLIREPNAVALDPGEHRFVIRVGQHSSVEKVISLSRGDQLRVRARQLVAPVARHASLNKRAAGYVLGGVGILGIGISAILAARVVQQNGKNPCPSGPGLCSGEAIETWHSNGQAEAIGALTSGVLGATLLTAGGLLAFLPRQRDGAAMFSFTPLIGRAGGGLTAVGTW